MREDNFIDDLGRSAAGLGRAAIGQGIGMAWGDEAEAWLKSKIGQGTYEENLAKIREAYGDYASQNPWTAGLAEFAGAALPAAASVMIPGAQGAAPAAVGALGRLAGRAAGSVGLGAAQGAAAGSGAAEGDDRASGAVSGALLGAALSGAVPVATGTGKSAYNWLADRLTTPTAERAERSAASKINRALEESGMTPAEITGVMARDSYLGVPSVVANASSGLGDLAEAVAQRTGPGTRTVEDTLSAQKLGSRERVNQQVVKGLNPGNYYDDLEQLQSSMKTRAAPLYREAYLYGEVMEPRVLQYLQLPQFQKAFGKAQELAEAEGRTVDFSTPTVETLDNLKQGLDRLIEAETDATTGKVTKLGAAYIAKKNEFLDELDKVVPAYKQARAVYRGDAELQDAMRSGLKEFGRLDHEQVIKRVSAMDEGQKAAFRTGVARKLYDDIMVPSQNVNAAQRVIGSPESKAKLQALFDDPAKYRLFEAALSREQQMFERSNRILFGSGTAKRREMGRDLDKSEGPSLGEVALSGATGGFTASIPAMAMRLLNSQRISPAVADKMATMLMSKSPTEVAAVVSVLEKQVAREPIAASASKAANRGITGGLSTSVYSPPAGSPPQAAQQTDIEDYQPELPEFDIEADIAAENGER